MAEHTVRSVDEMYRVAADVAAQVRGGEVLLLDGELGSGKTTFVQGLARALGVTGRVTSPTFTIVGEYPVPDGKISTLVHVDLYRLDEGAGGGDPAVRDALERASEPDRLTVVEWAQRLGELMPAGARRLSFFHDAPDSRIVTIEE